MVNYESVVIETNQELLKEGREPLYAIYPVDGLATYRRKRQRLPRRLYLRSELS